MHCIHASNTGNIGGDVVTTSKTVSSVLTRSHNISQRCDLPVITSDRAGIGAKTCSCRYLNIGLTMFGISLSVPMPCRAHLV